MNNAYLHLKAIVFDLAGTTVDHGSCAPASVFQEIFRRRGVTVTTAQAREPMGKAKRDHILSILQMPEVADDWQAKHGRAADDADVDALYDEFLPLQMEVIGQHSDLIAGAAEMVNDCRARGLKIGATTGYTRELLGAVLSAAVKQGFQPDCAFGAEDAPQGRPAPFLLFEVAKRLAVYPMWHVVKVDDTPVGIQAGRNAGCWTVGITRTGNCVGLNPSQWEQVDAQEQKRLIARADQTLTDAGAHATLESVADLGPVLEQFDAALTEGRLPLEAGAIANS